MHRSLCRMAMIASMVSAPAMAQMAPTAPATPPEMSAAPVVQQTEPFIRSSPSSQTPPATMQEKPPQAAQAPSPVTDSTLPQLPVPAAPAATSALPPVPVADAVIPAGQVFSFGKAQHSLLFTPLQISQMKRALASYEGGTHDTAPAQDLSITEALPVEPAKIEEPAEYPVFQLSSVAYHTPSDWAVWLNGKRITPAHNTGEVVVTKVAPDRVWFSWKPTYIQAVGARINQHNFAPTKAVANRLSTPNTASYNRETGSVDFSLRPNQSFAAGYFNIFEGRVPSVPLSPPPAESAAGDNTTMSPQSAETINNLLGSDHAPATTPAPTPAPAPAGALIPQSAPSNQ